MDVGAILVPGTSGIVGTAITTTLRERGCDIVGADTDPHPSNSTVVDLTITHDLREKAPPDFGLQFDAVVHLTANSRVRECVVNPGFGFENVQTTFSA